MLLPKGYGECHLCIMFQLITTVMSQRSQSPSSPAFDGVIFVLSSSILAPSDEPSSPTSCKCCLLARGEEPQTACVCCQCSRDRHAHHNRTRDAISGDNPVATSRLRSFASRVAAVKSMIEYISPSPYLILLSSQASQPTPVQMDEAKKEQAHEESDFESQVSVIHQLLPRVADSQ